MGGRHSAKYRSRRPISEVRAIAFQNGCIWGAAIVAWAQAIQDRETEKAWDAMDRSSDEAQRKMDEAAERERFRVMG